MNTDILKLFAEFLEKQDTLSKLTEHEKLHDYGYSEIHVIAAIGDLDEPNVTQIAKTLSLTKGAISKITRKLIASNLVEAYSLPGNRQKIFFKLTSEGRFLYEEHEKRHKKWRQRDTRFLEQFTGRQLEQISDFMTAYNAYLNEQIQESGGLKNAD